MTYGAARCSKGSASSAAPPSVSARTASGQRMCIPSGCRKFSCHAGDLIVLGEAMEPDPRPANLEKKYQTLTVVGCTDNRGKREPHWKVIAK